MTRPEPVPESERWDPVPGSTGHRVPGGSNDDEDEGGRSDINGSWKKASLERSMTKWSKPPEQQRARRAARLNTVDHF